jgi:hypothetical protein
MLAVGSQLVRTPLSGEIGMHRLMNGVMRALGPPAVRRYIARQATASAEAIDGAASGDDDP